VATLAPLNPDIEFADAHTSFSKGATATQCFCSPAGRSGYAGCHTFCKSAGLPLLQCSFHSLRLLPTLILRDNNILRSLHSHRTAVSRQELNSARHPVPSFAHFLTTSSTCPNRHPWTKRCATPAEISRRHSHSWPRAPFCHHPRSIRNGSRLSTPQQKTLHFVPQFFYCSVSDNLFFRQAKSPTINRQLVQVHPMQDSEPNHFN